MAGANRPGRWCRRGRKRIPRRSDQCERPASWQLPTVDSQSASHRRCFLENRFHHLCVPDAEKEGEVCDGEAVAHEMAVGNGPPCKIARNGWVELSETSGGSGSVERIGQVRSEEHTSELQSR